LGRETQQLRRRFRTRIPGTHGRASPMGEEMSTGAAYQTLIDIGRQFYERRWMWGTAGNLSLRITSGVRSKTMHARQTHQIGPDPSRDALSIAITPSGLNKGHLSVGDLLVIRDGESRPKYPRGLVPSSETVIHQAIYRAVPGAGAVMISCRNRSLAKSRSSSIWAGWT